MSNYSEADPEAGWSTPRDYQEDVRYALALANIVLNHWEAKLNGKIFAKFEDLSNDNAFMSYHPFEFSQRTLLAHFRMNNSDPPHSQFIQKPVYAAMGMLSRLANMAASPTIIKTNIGLPLNVLKTTANKGQPMYFSWLIVPVFESAYDDVIVAEKFHLCANEVIAFIIEVIDQQHTNPVQIWRSFNSPSYPNATVREAMRFHQTLKVHDDGILTTRDIHIKLTTLVYPWVLLLRICSNLNSILDPPQNLQISRVTQGEVLLTWVEATIKNVSAQCLRTYEIWFRPNQRGAWSYISLGWHLPFPLFQYAPLQQNDKNVNGKLGVIE